MKTLYIIHLSDSRKYIGMTGSLLRIRLSRHKSNTNNAWLQQYMIPLYQAIRATGGWDTVRTSEVLQVPDEYADIVERNFIRYYNTTNPTFGLNATSGGVRGYTYTPEALERGKPRMSVKVYKYDTDEFVGQYDSCQEVCRALGTNSGSVSHMLNGKANHANGYYFKLVSDGKPIIKFIPPSVCLGTPIVTFRSSTKDA